MFGSAQVTRVSHIVVVSESRAIVAYVFVAFKTSMFCDSDPTLSTRDDVGVFQFENFHQSQHAMFDVDFNARNVVFQLFDA
jgi:hypothetical protein